MCDADLMATQPEPLDLAAPVPLRARMARDGLMFAQLQHYWSPDTDSMVDPLNDPEVRQTVRVFMGHLWAAALRAEAS